MNLYETYYHSPISVIPLVYDPPVHPSTRKSLLPLLVDATATTSPSFGMCESNRD